MCVTGLVVVDTADTFNVFGQTIIASFNNAGFDNLGGFVNLASYKENVLLNLTTSGLIIFGGLGFFVVRDIFTKKNYKKFNLNSKITITMTLALLLLGTLLLKITEGLPWLGAFFYSTSTRTAGFSTYPISDFSEAGLFVIIMLMFVGASPASTGGGIKTTTFFALILSVFSFATNRDRVVFKRKLPNEVIIKAYMLSTLSIGLICLNSLMLMMIEPSLRFLSVFFEVTSAFGTVGLSMGITPFLKPLSKIIIIFTMFIGRLGPLTMATIWTYIPSKGLSYSEEDITIG